MLGLCFAGLALLCIFLLIFRKYEFTVIEETCGKHWHNFFNACSLWIGRWIYKDNISQREELRCLHPLGNIKEMMMDKQIKIGQLVIVLWLVIPVSGIGLLLLFKQECKIRDGFRIERQIDDGTAETIIASAYGESFVIESIRIPINDKLVDAGEREILFEQAKMYILDAVKGKNASFSEVRESLNLVTSIPETSMTVSWNMDQAPYIFSDGSIDAVRIPDDGVVQTLTAILDYGSEQQSVNVEMRVYPPIKSLEDIVIDEIMQQIEAENMDGQYKDNFMLPSKAAGQTIEWKEAKNNMAMQIILLMILLSVVWGIYCAGKGKREIKKREQQLKEDYPNFIHKLVLLTNAGVNTRSALQMITESGKKQNGVRTRYVYEETEVILKLMQHGIAEIKAYEMFGKNCGDRLYIKLGMLMIQCVKMGASGMNELLSGMADEALMMHRDQIRQKGEIAGTKLLMPMGLMLVVVFMILVVPAFLSINI